MGNFGPLCDGAENSVSVIDQVVQLDMELKTLELESKLWNWN